MTIKLGLRNPNLLILYWMMERSYDIFYVEINKPFIKGSLIFWAIWVGL
jgi:hypothetical protein